MTTGEDARVPAYFRRLAASRGGDGRIVTTLTVEVFPHQAVNARYARLSRARLKAAREFAMRDAG